MKKETKDQIVLMGLFVALWVLLSALMFDRFPDADPFFWTGPSAVATFFLFLGALYIGNQKPRGGAAWKDFFRASPRSVVVVVTTPEKVLETMQTLRLGGWAPMEASSAAMGLA